MREPTPTQQPLAPQDTRQPSLRPTHMWERAVDTVVNDTPPLIDNVYHRIAGEHPPYMANAPTQDEFEAWWRKLYMPRGMLQPTPDLEAVAELVTRAPENEQKDLIARLRKAEREGRAGLPDAMIAPERPSEMRVPGGRSSPALRAAAETRPYTFPARPLR